MSFAVVAALMTMTPGLDTALVLRIAATQSRSRAFAAGLGINSGVLVWGVGAAVGVSALLTASEIAYICLRYLGAAYMLWLGIGMLRSAWRNRGLPNDALPTTKSGHWGYFRQGFVVNILNPKIGAFYVAILPQFIPLDMPAAVAGVLMAMIHNVEGLLWFAVIIVAVGRMRTVFRNPAVSRWVDAIAGSVVVGFGAKLALTRS